VNRGLNGPVNRGLNGPVNRGLNGPVNRRLNGPVNRGLNGPVSRREPAIAAVLAAVGGALALWASTRTWVVLTTPRPAPLPAVRDAVTGKDAVPWAAAMAFLAVAGAAALLATRRVGRVVLGAVLALAGAAIAAGAVLGARPGSSTVQRAAVTAGWPALFGIGGLAVAAAGVLTVLRGRRWAELGARYEAPGAARPETGTAPGLWDALDRGDDPTARPADGPSA
jgi:hypothetical protein